MRQGIRFQGREADLPRLLSKAVKFKTLPTLRERQVIELLCEGFANKEIAARLHLTTGTIKIYIYLLLKKYGVDNRTQLALKFQKLKMTLHPPVE